MRYLDVYLAKHVQDLYKENYKTKTKLLEEIKEDLNKWKNLLCLWVGKLNIEKKLCLFFPHLSIGLIKFLQNSSMDFYRNRQVCSKKYVEKHRSFSGKNNLDK